MYPATFQLKENDGEISFSKSEVAEIVPDADMRFSLVILTSGAKHFVQGTEQDILEKLESESAPGHAS
ncbi:hypothetical protein [Dyadobacter sandarakinus]|uniref:Uncharacterized protein n=1 Tax=Dyadobacter sandarakinus TaxID=2747268 RepID=A0ABX7I5I6_9BACT|nr:hypothetical protein [Dyadobacter sandarakinus]QRR01140.1 hypothetical protein HWI92_09600 [Dyadobacter sandarakinus]